MKRNRKIKKNAAFTSGPWWVVALIVTALIVAMVYYMLDSQREQISRDIGKAEKRMAELDSEFGRESARWEEMKIRERLEEKLVRFGLEMKYPRHDQIVHMDPDGRPKKRSRATIARAVARMKSGEMAMNSSVDGIGASERRRASLKRVSSVASSKRTARR